MDGADKLGDEYGVFAIILPNGSVSDFIYKFKFHK